MFFQKSHQLRDAPEQARFCFAIFGAAVKGVCMEPLVYETHMHTPLCKHARGLPEDYAEAALRKGLKGITVTCHAPLPPDCSPGVRMSPDQWGEYQDLVAACRETYAGKLNVLLGVESDFLPGLEPWLEKLHASADLHYVLGSVHPQTPEYQARYLNPDDWAAFHTQYFTSLAEAAETGLFDCLAHPDLVKNYGTEFWDLEQRFPHILRCLDRIAATGTAMELNTSGLHKTIPEMNPNPAMLRAMRERGIPVVVGADAHEPGRVAGDFARAFELLLRCGFDQIRRFQNRRPIDLPLDQALCSLQGCPF